MTDPCRLCLGMTEVNNSIFGDDNKIYLKMVACLPVKVTKEDTLPKKICDVCSCKVDDFYQFCHRAVEAENRLYVTHAKSELDGDTSGIPNGVSNVSADLLDFERNRTRLSSNFPIINGLYTQRPEATPARALNSVHTQTDETPNILQTSDIKQEDLQTSPLQFDSFNHNEDDSFFFDNEKLEPDSLDPAVEENCRETEAAEHNRSKNKRPKKTKKHKELKIKLKRTRSGKRFAVLTDYHTDTDDELSLKSLKSKQPKQSSSKPDADDREVELLNASDIKTELQEFSWELEVEPLRDEFEPAKEDWNCCVCFLRFFNRTGMLNHYRTHYKSPELFKCELLQVQIVDENEDKSKTYTCPVCEKKFIAKRTYSTHLGKHAVEKPYKCSLCEKTFKNPLEILKHGKKSHTYDNPDGDSGDLLDKGPRPTSKRFICDMCDETFVYMKYLLAHRNASHPESKGRHLVNRCLHCRREFSHLNSLRRHLRSHSGERNFLCYMCGKALTSREHLKFHLRIHTGFKPNVCKTCGKGFVKKCNLTLHERVHSGERPHVCSHCGKAFSQRSTLVIHERYHSGSRPYVCNLCNKGFVAKGLLSMHMKTSCI